MSIQPEWDTNLLKIIDKYLVKPKNDKFYVNPQKINILLEETTKLLMDKYIVSNHEIDVICETIDHIHKEPILIDHILDYAPPVSQEIFDKHYESIPVYHVRHLKWDIEHYIYYYNYCIRISGCCIDNVRRYDVGSIYEILKLKLEENKNLEKK